MWSSLITTAAPNKETYGSQKGGLGKDGHPLLER